MLTRRRLAIIPAVFTLVLMSVLVNSPGAQADDPCNLRNCGTTVTASASTTVIPTGGNTGGGSPSPTTCLEIYEAQPLDHPARAYVLEHLGVPDTGQIIYRSRCANDDQDDLGLFWNYFLEADAPPPDPYLIAQEVATTLYLKDPTIQFGPDENKVAVNLPVWLALTDPGNVTQTSPPDRGLTVTVSAKITTVSWDLGEPNRDAVPCNGIGRLPTTSDNLSEPECGFVYTQRSLPERTGGLGKWPVRATVNWELTWFAAQDGVPTGQGDIIYRTTTSDTSLYVGEYSTVIVPN